MNRIVQLIEMMLILVFVGCGNSSDIIGSWYQIDEGSEGKELIFFNNGTFRGGIRENLTGTYSYSIKERKGMLDYDNFTYSPEFVLIENTIIVDYRAGGILKFTRGEMNDSMNTFSEALYRGLVLGFVFCIIFIGYKFLKKK